MFNRTLWIPTAFCLPASKEYGLAGSDISERTKSTTDEKNKKAFSIIHIMLVISQNP